MKPGLPRRVVMWIVAVPFAVMTGILAAFTVQLLRVHALLERPPKDALLPNTTVLVAVLAMYLLLRGSRGILAVLQRGFMIGTIQWLLMLTIINAYGYEVTAPPDPGPPRASWEPAPPLTRLPGTPDTLLTGFALVCAAGWGIAWFAEGVVRQREKRVGPAAAPSAIPRKAADRSGS